MKNKEKFAKEILDIACSGDRIALVKGALKPCECISCDDCDFYKKEISCSIRAGEWAESEYEEPKIQPEVKNCKVDDKILVSHDGISWERRHFARYDEEQDIVYAFDSGLTSWTTVLTCNWLYAKLPEREAGE